jgi:hypothetical protein
MNRVGKIVPPKRQILKDISLSFFPGAKIGVLGTNGSGKSTLLKIMAGIDKEIEGEAIPMTGLKIGYLPQEPQLDPEHTVRQSVESGMGEVKEAQARLEEVYAAYAEEDADFDALADAARETGARIVLTAHHREDRLETFLIQWLRGAGVDGLAAFPPSRTFGTDLLLVRPFVDVSRAAIEDYVASLPVAAMGLAPGDLRPPALLAVPSGSAPSRPPPHPHRRRIAQ